MIRPSKNFTRKKAELRGLVVSLVPAREQKALSRAIAAYVVAAIQDDRAQRPMVDASLFGKIFGPMPRPEGRS